MISLYVDKEQGIRRHLREGIWYPPGSILEGYTISAKAPLEQKINKVCALYGSLFRARVQYCCAWTEADAMGLSKALGPGCDDCIVKQEE
jgi:hypothetical protein